MTSWPRKPLGSIATIDRHGIAPESIQQGSLYVGLENIERGGRIVGVEPTTTGQLASAKFCFDTRHVLFGKLRPYLAKIARPNFDGICSTDILPLRPGPDLDRDYLAHFLALPDVVQLATSRAAGVNLPRISPSELQKFEVPLPPIEEQRRIADVLDRANALRTMRRTSLGYLDDLAMVNFDRALSAARADGCPYIPLSDAAESVVVAHVGPTSDFVTPDGIPFLRTANIKGSEVDTRGLISISPSFHDRLRKSSLRSGDIIVSRHVTNEVKCAIIPPDLDGSNCANMIVIRPGNAVGANFLTHLIRAPASQSAFLSRQTGSAQRVVNTKVLQSWLVPVPSLRIQRDFDAQVSTIGHLRKDALRSLEGFDGLFDTLQRQAFAR